MTSRALRIAAALAIGLLAWGAAPTRAQGVGGAAGGAPPSGMLGPSAIGNAVANPYMNPYLNPYATQANTSPDMMLLYMLGARQYQNQRQMPAAAPAGGRGVGVPVPGRGRARGQRTAEFGADMTVPGGGAAGYFNRDSGRAAGRRRSRSAVVHGDASLPGGGATRYYYRGAARRQSPDGYPTLPHLAPTVVNP